MEENKLCGRPLKFGDVEQINERKRLEREQEDEENKKKYVVRFDISGSLEIEVDAFDEDDAEEKAREELDDMSVYNRCEYVEFDLEGVWEAK